jgi:hypothetical protein
VCVPCLTDADNGWRAVGHWIGSVCAFVRVSVEEAVCAETEGRACLPLGLNCMLCLLSASRQVRARPHLDPARASNGLTNNIYHNSNYNNDNYIYNYNYNY